MTFFMVGRDPRMPSRDGELTAHAWCSTTFPQPDRYEPGKQLFCASARFWSRSMAGSSYGYSGAERIRARMKATLEVVTMIKAHAKQARVEGHVFAFPASVIIIEPDSEGHVLPWSLASKLLPEGQLVPMRRGAMEGGGSDEPGGVPTA